MKFSPHSMLRRLNYESIPVFATVIMLGAIQQVGAGQRSRSTPPPSGERIGNKSWAYEMINPCYVPQYNLAPSVQQHFAPQPLSYHSSSINQENAQNIQTEAYVSQDGVKYMINTRRKRNANETDDLNHSVTGESYRINDEGRRISGSQEHISSQSQTQSHHHSQTQSGHQSQPQSHHESQTQSEHQSQTQSHHESQTQSQHQSSSGSLQQGVEGQLRPSYEDYQNAKLSIIHSVFQVGGYLETFLNLEMGGEECMGLDLQTLADYPVIQQNFVVTTLQFYGYMTSVRAHVLTMLSDWDDSRMYSCGSINKKLNIIRGLRGLDEKLKALLCTLRVDLDTLGVQEHDLHLISQSVLDTIIYRYPSCLSRKMRDCLVVNKIQQAFSIAIHSLTRG